MKPAGEGGGRRVEMRRRENPQGWRCMGLQSQNGDRDDEVTVVGATLVILPSF
jgi:hypothetical protein